MHLANTIYVLNLKTQLIARNHNKVVINLEGASLDREAHDLARKITEYNLAETQVAATIYNWGPAKRNTGGKQIILPSTENRTPDTANTEEQNWNVPPSRHQQKKQSEIHINIGKTSYLEALAAVKQTLESKGWDREVDSSRKSRTGLMVLRMKKGTGKTQEVLEGIRALPDCTQVRVFKNPCLIEVNNMDIDATKEKLVEALKEAIPQDPEPEVAWIRDNGAGTRKWALIKVDAEDAELLLKSGTIRVGLTNAKLRPQRQRLQPCYRCRGYGHARNVCVGPDRSMLCRKCWRDGHEEKQCNDAVRCAPCETDGNPCDHYTGSSRCANYKQAFAVTQRKETVADTQEENPPEARPAPSKNQ